jgi:ribokinase
VGRTAGAAGDPESLARTLLEPNSEGPGVRQAVVVTLGAAGVVVVRRDGPAADLPTLTVTAVDTVGAGDAFNGALAAGLATGLDLDGAIRRAIAAAALSTTREGAREGMPTAPEVEELLAAG